jgi:filamentous hemagglutinin family protein
MLHSKKVWHRCLRLAGCLAIAGALTELSFASAFSEKSALAQIVPDTTLGGENSIITPNVNVGGRAADRIDGGAARGANLFHSFSQFNIRDGQRVYFANPGGIENILSRVTGNNISNILGTLGVLDNANLFLINPNGIVFGSNARLDIAGSFVASTANSLVFDNGFAFSATAPQAPPLLTINVPIGLQYAGNAGSIQVQGSRLRVPNGETLALVGGLVSLDGAAVGALGGRVELAAVGGSGIVGLSVNDDNLRLSFPDTLVRADVSLRNDAFVDVTAGGGGTIAIHARNLELLGGSSLLAGIGRGLGSPDSKAGDIEVNASEAINVEGKGGIDNSVLPTGRGKGGNINITTGSLSVTNGAQLAVGLFGQGEAGTVTIRATNTVSLDGVGDDGFASGVFGTVQRGAVGKGGSINIITGSLSATNGAQVNTRTFGYGDSGNITITARDTISFDGSGDGDGGGGAFSIVQREAVGNGGNINITTGSLSVTNGAQLAVSTRGQGNAGNVTIRAMDTVLFDGESNQDIPSGAFSRVNPEAIGKGGDIDITTGSLRVTRGALLTTATRGQGDAGNLRINAHEFVSFDGVDSNGFPSAALSTVSPGAIGKGGDINITTRSLSATNSAQINSSTLGQGDAGNITVLANTFDASNGGQLLASTTSNRDAGNITLLVSDQVTLSSNGSGILANTTSSSTGSGGSIFLEPRSLIIRDGARIAVDSQGTGRGGDIQIEADSINLDNRASISAETASNIGGDIKLQVSDYILMRNRSLINARAFNNGSGGNIDINAGFVVAIPKENSDIIANAVKGSGGRIRITAQGIFGLEFRDPLTPLSDINASSQFGVDGVVEINTPDVDPSRGLAELPANLVDPSTQIAQSCPGSGGATAGKLSKFIVTGSGGLPASPSEPFNGDAVWHDLRPMTQQATNRSVQVVQPEESGTKKLVEAQGWVIGANGEVILTASAPTVAPHNLQVTPIACPGS